ncbi:PHD finger family protein [Actinidia rufa]|uniref:PHD finger family protein n=1 Tax=Actinidia rufa TaxID=165716 RepID=A0A7J0GPV8_9ERIC|nr:PHD finger family protein [Actinidia rufa]
MSSGSVIQLADSCDLTRQSFSGKLSFMEFATCISGNSNGSYRGHASNPCLAVNMFSQSKEGSKQVAGRGCRNSSDDHLFIGTHPKSQTYVNNYTHGDFAASAAANLAILSSEENRVSESQVSDSRSKVVSANNLLQVKSFSSASIRFFWPNSEKNLVEVPRETCGATKFLAGLCPAKNGEGSLPGIAMYVMLMEESLYGLTIGPFQNASYREQWRKQVEQATTCGAIKALLLNVIVATLEYAPPRLGLPYSGLIPKNLQTKTDFEPEENIHAVALSGDWVKRVDDRSVESSVTQIATFASGSSSTHKRGRRGRRQSAVPKVTSDDSLDNSSGCRKTPGIHYAESSEIPKRRRQYIWRAAVEMSKNASQLALQVRYLDFHVRWNDLVRPEQNLQDGTGQETEASVFRNAFVCDKKNVANKIIDGVAFGDQTHIPSRVLKNIVEIEQSQDGRQKYWNAVKCSSCQGFCHVQCTISSTIKRNDEVEFLITCKQCCYTKTLPQTESVNESPTSPLLLQGQEWRDAVTVSKGAKWKKCNQSLTSVGHLESSLETKSAMHDASVVPVNGCKLCSWGLIWKRNRPEENGVDLRKKSLLLRGNSDMSCSGDSGPVCHLCSNPYNSNLICCRIRTPMCPYLDQEVKKKLEAKRPRTRAPKVGNPELDPHHGTISGQPIELKSTLSELPKTEDVVTVNEEDPLLSPLPMVKQSTYHNLEMNLEWNTVTDCGTGTKKLPVRRLAKNKKNVDGTTTNNLSQVELSTPIEPNNLMNPAEEPLPPCVEWDVSRNGFEDDLFFSFTELLVSDDIGELDEVDVSGYVIGDWEKGSAISHDGSPELCGKGANNQQDSSITEEPCRKCSLKEPCPDLRCEICGLWMHQDCSPWDEQPSWEGNWRCGHCREWQ